MDVSQSDEQGSGARRERQSFLKHRPRLVEAAELTEPVAKIGERLGESGRRDTASRNWPSASSRRPTASKALASKVSTDASAAFRAVFCNGSIASPARPRMSRALPRIWAARRFPGSVRQTGAASRTASSGRPVRNAWLACSSARAAGFGRAELGCFTSISAAPLCGTGWLSPADFLRKRPPLSWPWPTRRPAPEGRSCSISSWPSATTC